MTGVRTEGRAHHLDEVPGKGKAYDCFEVTKQISFYDFSRLRSEIIRSLHSHQSVLNDGFYRVRLRKFQTHL